MNITEAFGTDSAHKGDLVITSSGDIGRISGLDNYKNAIFHRIMTVPGSLVHRPTYGVGVAAYQNAPTSFGIQQKLALLIEEQIAQDARTERVNGIVISAGDGTPNQFLVKVSVKPIGYSDQEFLFTPFSEGI